MPRVCVFCGANAGHGRRFLEAAEKLGVTLATRGFGLVYGGASVGLMGALADAALAAGGEVVGVIPRTLVEREIAHTGLSELVVVESMHARKAKMVALADAFIAMPGGFGTLDELFEVTTWAQLGLHHKPIGLLDLDGWFAPLVAYVAQALEAGLVKPEFSRLWTSASEIDVLLDRLFARI